MTKKTLFIAGLIAVALWVPAAGLAADAATAKAVDQTITWYSYDEGLALAKKDGKQIFLHFYADWCHYCKEMKKKTFTSSAVIRYLNDHFISILVNTDKNRKITGNYFVRGLPATFFLTAPGEKLHLPIEGNRKMSNIPGFIPDKMLLKLLRFVHTEGYNTLTFREYSEKKDAENPNQ